MTDRQQGIYGWNLPFPKTRWAMIGFVAGVFTWSFAGGGQQRHSADNGTVADARDQGSVSAVDSTFGRISQGVQDATSSVRDRISTAQNSAHNMSLGTRVKERLSREKSIDDDRIEVQVKDDATVILNGQVPDTGDKEAAVDLARSTDGVRRVEDNLSVPPARRVFAVKSDEDAPATSRTR